ncbi:MAG: HAD family phosphatase [Chloroflexi bacterium]|nr:HAD family phosphatase [Chloroflexota bacterium]
MIKLVLFDCGGVVMKADDAHIKARWAAKYGLTTEELRRILWESEGCRLSEIGEISDHAYWESLASQFPLATPQELQVMRAELWGAFAVNPRVLAWVDRMRAHYRVALLSNASDVIAPLLEQHGLTAHLDAIYISCDLGVTKPDAGIFLKVLRTEGVAAHEALFIDDRAESVAAAAAQGMHILWYVGEDELDRQLQVYLPTEQPASSMQEGEHAAPV